MDIGVLNSDVQRMKRDLTQYRPATQDVRISANEDSCENILALSTQVASLEGQLKVMNWLIRGVIAILLGIFISGLF